MEPIIQNPIQPIVSQSVSTRKHIKFVYAALIITILGAGTVFGLERYQAVMPADVETVVLYVEKNITPLPEVKIYDNPWEGERDTINSSFSGGKLIVRNVTKKSFDFTLWASYGGNTGRIGDMDVSVEKATAIITNNTAVYDGGEDYEGNQCTLSFSLDKDTIKITDPDFSCANLYAGNNVSFEGIYVRNGKPKQETLEEKMVLFKEKPQFYTAFKTLVGGYFEEFENTLMQGGSVNDKDNFGVEVNTFGVAGLYTLMESIVMVAPDGKIWAAVIYLDEDAKKDPTVLYFTNVPGWKNKLPKTIDAWRERFSDYKVIYMSK